MRKGKWQVGSSKGEVASKKWQVASGKWQVGPVESGKWDQWRVGSGEWENRQVNEIISDNSKHYIVSDPTSHPPLLPLIKNQTAISQFTQKGS